MGDDTPERTGLTNWEAVDIAYAFFKRWGEIRLRDIEEDLATIRASNGDDPRSNPEATFAALTLRAKWHKRMDLMLEAERVFDKRYGTPRGELRLIEEMFGEQLGLEPSLSAADVRQRLDWYQRRVGSEYSRDVRAVIDKHNVTSPIEQVFLMEWHFNRIDDRFGVALTPQHEVTVSGLTYRVDFVVVKDGSPIRIAIELDGHDFHEKTREQVRKDKERERAIVRQGFTVLRFAGSEVMKNPKKCVDEVVELLRSA